MALILWKLQTTDLVGWPSTWCFLVIRFRLRAFSSTLAEMVPYSPESHQVVHDSVLSIIHVTVDILTRVVSTSFFHCKVFLLLKLICLVRRHFETICSVLPQTFHLSTYLSLFYPVSDNPFISFLIWMLRMYFNVPDLPSRIPFKLASVFFGCVPILWALLCYLKQDVSGGSCTFPSPAVESAISPRSPDSI